ncbi:MAG: argininosuccinate lyase [Kiritimatiellae bacterium]|nr:argininosuccinate lyase [Kiritimatiellia bacterium]
MARRTTVGVIDADVLAYTAGEDRVLDQALLEADCMGSAAHVTMLSRMRLDGNRQLLTAEEASQVVDELRGLWQEGQEGRFEITLDDQDVHLAIERRLTEKLGALGKRVHTCRSRNDQVAVDLRLWGRQKLAETQAALAATAKALLALGKKYRRVPMVGRTHMQPAMPSSVGLWASAWSEALVDDAELLETAARLNNRCPLGSAASYGVPLPIDRELTAKLLDFDGPVHNVLHANQSRGQLESIQLSALAQVMLTLSRLAQDLILFSMPEFGYFTLPVAFTTGSSIMPQKRNPDVCELMRAKAAKVLADAQLVAEIVRAAPSGYNRDLQETKAPYMEGFAITLASLRILPPMLAGLVVHEDKLREAFSPAVYATDRALELVAGGMPFRDAYDHVKAHLDELAARNPDEAITLKSHLGAPMGLDFDLMAAHVKAVESRARTALRRHIACRNKLLKIK